MPEYSYAIGTTTSTLVNLENLISCPPTDSEFTNTEALHTCADGSIIGEGYSQCSWLFIYLSWDDFALLLSYLHGKASEEVYITTRTPNNIYTTYKAIIHRPAIPGNAKQNVGGWFKVTFKFTHMIAI
jgi:hypothetical protein